MPHRLWQWKVPFSVQLFIYSFRLGMLCVCVCVCGTAAPLRQISQTGTDRRLDAWKKTKAVKQHHQRRATDTRRAANGQDASRHVFLRPHVPKIWKLGSVKPKTEMKSVWNGWLLNASRSTTGLKMWGKWWMRAVAGRPGSATENEGAENEKKDILSSATLRCWLQHCCVGGRRVIWSYNSLLLQPDDWFKSFKCECLTGSRPTATGGQFWKKHLSWHRCVVKQRGGSAESTLTKVTLFSFFAPLLSPAPSSSMQEQLRLCENKKEFSLEDEPLLGAPVSPHTLQLVWIISTSDGHFLPRKTTLSEHLAALGLAKMWRASSQEEKAWKSRFFELRLRQQLL